MPNLSPSALTCDVLVIGSGAGGLSTAVTARKGGLDVLVIEKEPFFGGTTAFSGGVLWVPGNHHAKQNGVTDTREAARTYLRYETGNFFKADAVEAFLDNAPRMLEFFERETEVKFLATKSRTTTPQSKAASTRDARWSRRPTMRASSAPKSAASGRP